MKASKLPADVHEVSSTLCQDLDLSDIPINESEDDEKIDSLIADKRK